MKRFSIMIICVVMLLSTLPVFSLADEASLVVSFSNDLPGSAAGTYTFNSKNKGSYSLFWTDGSGIKLMAQRGEKSIPYTALDTFSLNGADSYIFTPNPFLAIPAGAESIAVFDSKNVAVATFALPKNKLQSSSAVYSYGVLSDMHYDSTYNDTADKTVPAALAFFKESDIDFVFGCGDYVTYAGEEYYQRFHDHIVKSGVTFLGCGGNHEVIAGSEKMFGKDGTTGYFQKYLNIGVYDGTLEGVCEFAPNGYDFVYQIPGNENDVFIFVSQYRWDDGTTTMLPLIEIETVKWLETVFEKYKEKNVHYFQHTYLSDDDGQHTDGEGDISNKTGYGYNYHYNVHTEDEKMLRALMEKYKNVIWYNGHSHWAFSMDKYNRNLNIYDYEGITATMIHVPSVTAPRTTSDNDTSYQSNAGKLSMGIMTDVHNGYEICNGVDFTTGEICAYAVYIVYGGEDHLVTGKLGGSGTEFVFDKQLSTLRIVGTGAMPDFSLENVPPYAQYASDISSVYVARAVTAVGKDAFSSLKSLRKAEVKDCVERIGSDAFRNCRELTELILPDSVKEIGENAFSEVGTLRVAYGGTAERYGTVKIASGNSALDKASKIYGKYTVVWKVGDYIKTEEREADSLPFFGGVASMPADEADKFLPFKGWHNGIRLIAAGQALPKVKESTTFTAVFGEEKDRYITGAVNNSAIKWTLDRYNGTLTVDGKGTLPDIADEAKQPWREYVNEIYTVVVKGSVTTVGNKSFSKMPALTSIIFEKGVREIKMDAFAYNDYLTTVYFPVSITAVGQGASYQCKALTNILFAGTAEKWTAFQRKISGTYNPILKGATAEDVACEAAVPTNQSFTVTFFDEDGSVIKTFKNIKWGEGVIPPSAPSREDRTFLGWDSPYFTVTSDLTVKAVYTVTPDLVGPEPSFMPSEKSADETDSSFDTPDNEKEIDIVAIVVGVVIAVSVIGGGVAVLLIGFKRKKKH